MGAYAAIALLLIVTPPLLGQPRLVESLRIPVQGDISRVHGRPSARVYLVMTGTSERGWYESSSGRTYRTGGAGWGMDALDAPRGIWADALSVYIADRNNHRIVRYDTDLRPISEFRTLDTSFVPARFGYPIGVAVNARGDLGILDGESGELVAFDHRGRFLFRVGRDSRAGVTFENPIDLCVSGIDTWLVLDDKGFVEVDAFGTLVYRERLTLEDPRAIDADDMWIVTAGASGLQFHTYDHARHYPFPVRTFELIRPEARVDDVFLDRGRVVVVLDGVPVEFRLEGFER